MFSSLINAFVPRSQAATVQTLGHPAAGVVGWIDGSSPSSSMVSKETALTVAAFWCGVRILAETIGTLPCVLYRRTSDDSRERAIDDPRYRVIHDEPHPEMTPATFFETMTGHVVCGGNAYSRIVTDQRGMPERLELRLPETVQPKIVSDRMRYDIPSMNEHIDRESMVHIKGLGGDGITGWSVLKYGAVTIGGAIAGNERASSQAKSGATPGGALVHPMRLVKEAREQLRREWEEIHGGPQNAGRIAVLHGGIDFKPFSMSNEDAQFLESRVLSIRDIARLLRVPLHMLMDLENSSVRANIEAAGIEFLVYSMAPWIVRWQQELNRKLLLREERKSLYFEFMLDALMRGDVQQRYGAYSTARQWGFLSVNEIRRKENLNAIEGGDVYLQPANMVPAGTVPETIQAELQSNLAASLSEILDAGKQLRSAVEAGQASVLDAMDAASDSVAMAVASWRDDRELIRRDIQELGKVRVAIPDPWPRYKKKERAAVIRAATSQVERGESFINWMDMYYDSEMSEYPEWSAESRRQLLSACDGDPDGFVERIRKTVDSWKDRDR